MTWAIDTAARTLWQEVRGEPREGKIAVAHVIWNRVRDGRWGKSLATVCLWRAQFSGWYVPNAPNFKTSCALPDNDNDLLALREILEVAEHEPDPTGGATHYCNLSILPQPPAWVHDAIVTGKIGAHTFYKGVK